VPWRPSRRRPAQRGRMCVEEEGKEEEGVEEEEEE